MFLVKSMTSLGKKNETFLPEKNVLQRCNKGVQGKAAVACDDALRF